MIKRTDLDARGDVAIVDRGLPGDPFALLDVMPVAMFVIDGAASIVYANRRLSAMLGLPHDEVIGRSFADFVDPSDADFTANLLSTGSQDIGQIIGPTLVRYVDAAGERHPTQVWAHETPADFSVAGFVITLTPESVRDVLESTVLAMASDAPVDRALAVLAGAGRAAPLDGIGTILVVAPTSPTDEDRFRLIGDWPLSEELINAFGTPWRRCLVQGTPEDVVDSGFGNVDARSGAEMAMAGLPSAWVRPIFTRDGEVAAVFIVWRRDRSLVSANQETHIDETLRVAQMVLEHANHRRELEYAAHRDALTGVGNRASLNDRIELERGHPSVLCVDLDDFRKVNDTFGHAVGDEVIAQVGRRVSEAVRRSDDVYRAGGDQFIVVCDPEHGDPAGLIALAHRIVERINAPFDCREHRVRITATIGIASGHDHDGVSRSLQQVIGAADGALHVAKGRGAGSVHHADVLN